MIYLVFYLITEVIKKVKGKAKPYKKTGQVFKHLLKYCNIFQKKKKKSPDNGALNSPGSFYTYKTKDLML